MVAQPELAARATGDETTRPPADAIVSPRMVLDIVVAINLALPVAAAMLAKLLYVDLLSASPATGANYIILAIIGAGLLHHMLERRGFFQRSSLIARRGVLVGIATAHGATFLVLGAITFALKAGDDTSRVWFALWFCLSLTASTAFWHALPRIVGRLVDSGLLRRRIAIYGDPLNARRLAARLVAADSAIDIVGCYFDTAQQPAGERGGLDALLADAQARSVDQVIVILSQHTESQLQSIEQRLTVLAADISVFPAQLDTLSHVTGFGEVGGVTMLHAATKPISDWSRVVKLAEDYVVATVALLLFALPMLGIAAAIKLDSPGPVFFRQTRHGYNHRVIRVFKFRSMTVAPAGPEVTQAVRGDARVTRVGAFIRRTSLDELPQLFNVLKGEMSVVGPRPHALVHNRYYSQMLERYANRHRVKPGITGWAQINGFRGNTENPADMKARVRHDLHYIDNWSIWLDLKILLLTPIYGFINRNAF